MLGAIADIKLMWNVIEFVFFYISNENDYHISYIIYRDVITMVYNIYTHLYQSIMIYYKKIYKSNETEFN